MASQTILGLFLLGYIALEYFLNTRLRNKYSHKPEEEPTPSSSIVDSMMEE